MWRHRAAAWLIAIAERLHPGPPPRPAAPGGGVLIEIHVADSAHDPSRVARIVLAEIEKLHPKRAAS